jgi:acyl-coenzyme A thioesterase PaaI-like protein
VQFLRPASGERVECTATIVRAGKSLIFARAVLTAEPSGKEVATATATFAVP